MPNAQQSPERAYKEAQAELEAALQKFQAARAAFAKATGQFIGADDRLIRSFSQLATTVGQGTEAHELAQF
ncbi:hypothetical protein [Comamonas aquatica]|uniref:hypothetical protein n=1 Tax=Comamonas aquatica TaxID=225991 RepID=UPI003D03FA4E